MRKLVHEFRDPIHVFIRMSDEERQVLDSQPLQRLRHIHQLALTYLVYPGATHKRFEHSLGVMELAERVFNVITHHGVTDESRERFPELEDQPKLNHWKRTLRMAALCHDIGHLPFSHAAEKELLPEGWDHERITAELIRSDEMRSIWENMTPSLKTEEIVKLALGPKKYAKIEGKSLNAWESIMSEIIVGDSFGVDRMDYLLRDAYHAGVAYGKFDHYRLIDTLRILINPSVSDEPALGIEDGGLHSAEALALARYFMYSQVYFHPIRRIYDIHLKQFLHDWLPNGKFSTNLTKHQEITDNEVIAAMREKRSNIHASRIITRDHFKVLYQRNPKDIGKNRNSVELVYNAASKKFGKKSVHLDQYTPASGKAYFPVLMTDGRVISSLEHSSVLSQLPTVSVGFVFIDRRRIEEGKAWLTNNRDDIIQSEPDKESE